MRSTFYLFRISSRLIIMLLSASLILVGCQNTNNSLRDKIIKEIDKNCQNNNTCMISMKEITDFKWDRMVIFRVGSSNAEVSQALGFEYKGSTDLMSGMIFIISNKIVHEELVPYDPERYTKLQYAVTKGWQEPNCVSYTIDEATLVASKKETDGHFYYQITNRSKYKD